MPRWHSIAMTPQGQMPTPMPTPPASNALNATPKPSDTIKCATPNSASTPVSDPARAAPPIIDYTKLLSNTSPAEVARHIAPLQTQLNEYLNDIENIKTANANYQRKIENLIVQLPEAENEHSKRIQEREDITKEIAKAWKIIDELKATTKEFVSLS